MNNKKAQAASEYLHTYGWVILTATVLMGVLAFYGIGELRDNIPEECNFFAGLNCLDVSVEEENLLKISVINEFGFPVRNITFMANGSCNSIANTSDINPYDNPMVLTANQQAIFTFNCSNNLTGLKFKERLLFQFVSVESGAPHRKSGFFSYNPKKT